MGLSVGGQDVVYVKQDRSSNLAPSELKQHLDKLGDQLFTGTCTLPPFRSKSKEHKLKVTLILSLSLSKALTQIEFMRLINGLILTGSRGFQCVSLATRAC